MSAAPQPHGLRLLAEDEEDLAIISAYLQDAIVRVGDLAYLPRTHRFALVVNRYCWECDDAKAAGLRKRAGVHFDGVLRAKATHVKQDNPEAVLQLLAVRYQPGGEGASLIDLCFAGGGCIRLEVECVEAAMRDLGGPWPAQGRPAHDLENR